MKNLRNTNCCLCSFSCFLILSVATGCDHKDDKAEFEALLGKPCRSPSGKYILDVDLRESSTEGKFYTFRILAAGNDQDPDVRFESTDRFFARHTTWFFWDSMDRVWVYSGDVGTSYWQLDEQDVWAKVGYDRTVSAPPLLRERRPKIFGNGTNR